ncbi:MAG: hypothetical protein H0X25_05940 [Acidobacteriales bacterium]|nr:hypothetical protein [Terriglobales bacterium]
MNRVAVLVALCMALWLPAEGSPPQSGVAQAFSSVEPESGFLSPARYTNAFFGFFLPLPQNAGLTPIPLSSGAGNHFLYGLKAEGQNLSALSIFAQPVRKDPMAEAKAAARVGKKSSVKKIKIGGKDFWRGELTTDSPAGRATTVIYTTPLRGFVISFSILAFDSSLAQAFRQTVESLQFFDPQQAAQVAGAGSHPFNPAHPGGTAAPAPHSERIAQLDPGRISSGIYDNDELGVAFVLPAKWVVNESANRNRISEAEQEILKADAPEEARERELVQECARTLLFASPPSDGVSAASSTTFIALFAADPSCWPGVHFPGSPDDADARNQIANTFLRAIAAPPPPGTAFRFRTDPISGKKMLDANWGFNSGSAQTGPVHTHIGITMVEANGYWLTWEFVSPTAEGLEELRRMELAFVKPLPNRGH